MRLVVLATILPENYEDNQPVPNNHHNANNRRWRTGAWGAGGGGGVGGGAIGGKAIALIAH